MIGKRTGTKGRLLRRRDFRVCSSASAASVALLLLAALAVLLAGGCGRPAQRIAEKRLNALLPAFLGPADHYSTRVRDSTSGLLRGRLRSIHVDGVNVRMSDDLTVDRLALDVRDASVNTRTQRLNGVGSVTFAATIGEANLNRYVRTLRPDIEDLSVRLRAGEVILQAKPDVADLFGVPVSLRGTLRPRAGSDGTQLDFVPGGARVSVVPIPGPVVRFISERLNPVIDLTTLRTPIRVQQVAVRDGTVVLTGDADTAKLLTLVAEATPAR